ncbi:MAG TPA: DNA N-6-adenine-methyltransferase [Planctomycetaceae bacterium]|jgi:hypothetical protein
MRDATSSDEWYTPLPLIRALGKFDFDPACGPQCTNRTARTRIGPDRDGLIVPWRGRVWLNPPFSCVPPWADKFVEHGNGVMLCFCRSDALWFQRTIIAGGGFFLLRGRTQFERPTGTTGRCPLGCCLIPMGAANRRAVKNSGLAGVWCDAQEMRAA